MALGMSLGRTEYVEGFLLMETFERKLFTYLDQTESSCESHTQVNASLNSSQH